MSSDPEVRQPVHSTILAALRDACATLYPEEQAARVIVADAGLDERLIAFSSRAQTNWHNILAEAIRNHCLDTLLERVQAEYAAYLPLQTAIATYRQFIAMGGYLDVPPQEQTGVNPYDVYGLPNPYLGLRAFSYDDRAIYAGREHLAQETVQRLTAPGTQQTLLFITGASGSGKSSFAQAGLIPLLENHYAAYQKSVHHAIFRPSSQPMVMLADALQKLHPDLTTETLATNTPKDQINLLIIDQFEELFIQSDVSHRAPLCDFLTILPTFADCRTHLLITLRVDYLDELFAIQPLWAIAKEGVELRAMKADELRNAIPKPLQVHHPQKRFAPELLDRLVQDAGADAALLPLLQVTLAELWKTGRLVLSNYHSLTDAIRQRAELVYTFSDHASANPKIQRPAQDQQALLSIMLDLINVSVDGADRRDARQRRTCQGLEQGSAQRPRLIEELVSARLLSAASETRNGEEVEVIDIIHESLIENWDRLLQAIEEQRQQLQRRARFKLWLGEWLRNGRQDGYLLLTDMQLAEARTLVEGRDIEVQGLEAGEFYQDSVEYQASIQRTKDKTEAEHKARQQWLQWVSAAFIIMVIAAGAALWQWQRAETAHNEMEKLKEQISADQIAQKALLANLDITLDRYPQRALLLAVEAAKMVKPPLPSVLTTLHDLLGRTSGRRLGGHENSVTSVVFSPDAKTLASASWDNTVRLWSLENYDHPPLVLKGHQDGVWSVAFAPDGKTLASGSRDRTIRLWSLADPTSKPVELKGHQDDVHAVVFSPDGKMLASGSIDGTIRLWLLTEPNYPHVLLKKHKGTISEPPISDEVSEGIATGILDDAIFSLAFAPDGKTLASGSNDGTIQLWLLAELDRQPVLLKGHTGSINNLAFAPDGRTLASASLDGMVRLWSLIEPDLEPVVLKGHKGGAYSVAFAPDGKTLATGSYDGMIRLWSLFDPNYQPALLAEHEDIVWSVAFAPDGKTLASGGRNDTIWLWSLAESFGEPMVIKRHKKPVTSVAFTPNGRTLASGSYDGTIQVWSLAEPRAEPLVFKGHEDGVSTIAFAPDGEILASGNYDGTIRVWSLAEPNKEALVFKERIYDADTDFTSAVTHVTFTPDSKTLLSGSEDGTIRLWSLTESNHQPVVLKQRGMTPVFAPDGKTLASVADGIELWSLSEPYREAVVLKWHEDDVGISSRSIAFTPNGEMLVSGHSDGTIRLWNLKTEELLILACRKAGRNLSLEEWQQYFPNEEYRITCPQWSSGMKH